MSEKEITNNFTLVDMPDSIDNAIKNISDEPSKNIGQTLGDIWFLVFGVISRTADKKRLKYAKDLEIYKNELNQKVNEIPKNKRIEPSIQITAQALEKSKYCASSQELREMFINLISGTMNSDLEPLSHPSFPEIISQMNETDAKVLMEIKRAGGIVPVANFEHKLKIGRKIVFTNAYISSIFDIPMDKSNRSISLLERMGIVKVSYDTYINTPSYYDSFYNCSTFKKLQKESLVKGGFIAEIEKGICRATPLGLDFMNLCVS